MKKKDLDWTAAGLDRLGGDDDRIPVPVEDLKAAKKALEEAYVCLNEIPELDAKPFEEIAAELFVLHEKYAKLQRDCWINLVRAFATGAIVAWVVWDLLGK